MILVRPFTEADDVAGFHAAKGILTSEGGKASHAALVARGMGKPCVSGASALEIDVAAKTMRVNGTQLAEGDTLVIDGSAGVVTTDDVPLEEPKVSDEFQTVLGVGRRAAHARACARTRTPPRTPPGRASSAPRGWASAGPSTCSWPRTASRRCAG